MNETEDKFNIINGLVKPITVGGMILFVGGHQVHCETQLCGNFPHIVESHGGENPNVPPVVTIMAGTSTATSSATAVDSINWLKKL